MSYPVQYIDGPVLLRFVVESLYPFRNFFLLLGNGTEQMVPPGYLNSKTFVRVFAMVMDMKPVNFREQLCRYPPVQEPMHKSINDEAGIKTGKENDPVLIYYT